MIIITFLTRNGVFHEKLSSMRYKFIDYGPVYMEWGWFLLFSRSGGHKTKETYPTKPGFPTPCKQGL